MKHLIIDEKIIRKRIVDMNIKTISDLANNSGVSKPTIYDYLNGKTPVSVAFVRLCEYLDLNPSDILKEVDDVLEDENV